MEVDGMVAAVFPAHYLQAVSACGLFAVEGIAAYYGITGSGDGLGYACHLVFLYPEVAPPVIVVLPLVSLLASLRHIDGGFRR